MQTQMNQIMDALPMTKQDLSTRITNLHEVIRNRYDFIDRIAIALYDAKTDLLKTFVSTIHTRMLFSRREGSSHLKLLIDMPSISRISLDLFWLVLAAVPKNS